MVIGKGKLNFSSILSIFFVMVLLMTVVISYSGEYFGYHFRVVLSNSMAPKMPVGSLAMTKASLMENVKINDIVVVKVGESLVTHRVVSMNEEMQLMKTKGDNNQEIDAFEVTSDNLKESVLFSFPFIGHVLLKLQTTQGKMAGILLIVFVYLLDYLIKFLKEKEDEK